MLAQNRVVQIGGDLNLAVYVRIIWQGMGGIQMDGCLVMVFVVSGYYLPVFVLNIFRFRDKEDAKKSLYKWATMMAALLGALGISLLFQYLRK